MISDNMVNEAEQGMESVSDVVSCPLCKGEMTAIEGELRCRCGYSFKKYGGVFFINSGQTIKNRYAECYTANYYNSPQYDDSDGRINGILGLACPQKYHRILDLGCGSGQIALKCAKLGADVFGIDVSKDALNICAERSLEENVNTNLFEFDGKNIPFKSAVFDTIILSDVIEHIDDKTLGILTRECSRLLAPGGRLVIHSQPTKNIILLLKILKYISRNKIDIYSDITSSDFEFLHVRYHSCGSLHNILKKTELYAHIWGEFNIRNPYIQRLFNNRVLRSIFSDQLWCIAFKPNEYLKYSSANNIALSNKDYLRFLEMPSELDMGPCSKLYINYGFYTEEFIEDRYFRWTEKTASLFMGLPEDCKRAEIELCTYNPDVALKPICVRFYLNENLMSIFKFHDRQLHTCSINIPNGVRSGIVELKLELDRTFIPKKYKINDDVRELGVMIFNIRLI